MYPSPLNWTPAATELLGIAEVSDPLGIPGVFRGDGVKGVEKGWAADVDVAGGGDSGERRRGFVEIVRTKGLAELSSGLRRRLAQFLHNISMIHVQDCVYQVRHGHGTSVIGEICAEEILPLNIFVVI